MEAFELAGPYCQLGFHPNRNGGIPTRLCRRLPEAAWAAFGWEPDAGIPRLPIPDGAVRTAIYAEPWGCAFQRRRAVDEMVRILSPGGALLICASRTAPQTGRQAASFRLTPRGLERLLSGIGARLVAWQGDESFPHLLCGLTFKPPLSEAVLSGTSRFLGLFPARLDQLSERIGRWRQLRQVLAAWLSSRSASLRRHGSYDLRVAAHFLVDGELKRQLPRHLLPGVEGGGLRVER